MLRTGAGVLLALLAIAAQPSAWGQTLTTIDPQGAVFTSPVSINEAGQIVGLFADGNGLHGFVRDNDGTTTPFDGPGPFGTFPTYINAQGSVVGTYYDENFNVQIFVRAKGSTTSTPVTKLEVPSPAAYIYLVTGNSAGAIVGGFSDSNGKPGGFIRAPSGKFTFFEFPPAFLTTGFSPNILAMTPGATIVGSYLDSNFTMHGYLRTADGTITPFDPPNSVGTMPTSINDTGIVAGFFNDGSQNGNLRVFLRASDGTYSSFDTPTLGSNGAAASLNASGAVAGNVINNICNGGIFCTQVDFSFLRTANGTVKTVNDPLGVQGTQLGGINASGEMIGVYYDANGMQHGFAAKP